MVPLVNYQVGSSRYSFNIFLSRMKTHLGLELDYSLMLFFVKLSYNFGCGGPGKELIRCKGCSNVLACAMLCDHEFSSRLESENNLHKRKKKNKRVNFMSILICLFPRQRVGMWVYRLCPNQQLINSALMKPAQPSIISLNNTRGNVYKGSNYHKLKDAEKIITSPPHQIVIN